MTAASKPDFSKEDLKGTFVEISPGKFRSNTILVDKDRSQSHRLSFIPFQASGSVDSSTPQEETPVFPSTIESLPFD